MSASRGLLFVSNGIVGRAALNNALWCDAVCTTHHRPGEFHHSHWLSRLGAPHRYPDFVTLTGVEGVPAQLATIADLVHTPRRRGWAVKDSFQRLDLYRFGLEPLFDAEWLCAPSTKREQSDVPDVQWMTIDAEPDLARWAHAWRNAEADPDASPSHLFKPELLSRPDIRFISVVANGACVGGGVLNAGAGVVGLSNLFVDKIEMSAAWSGLANAARAMFPGLPLVAYDHGEALAAAHRAGFTTIGNLRVWLRRR
jgi:hypothetical protein